MHCLSRGECSVLVILALVVQEKMTLVLGDFDFGQEADDEAGDDEENGEGDDEDGDCVI